MYNENRINVHAVGQHKSQVDRISNSQTRPVGGRNRPQTKRMQPKHLRAEQLEARLLLTSELGALLWADIDEGPRPAAVRAIDFNRFELNSEVLESVLEGAPLEFTDAAKVPSTIQLPTPSGALQSFSFVNSPIMAPELAAEFPEINTYAGWASDDTATKVRFDWTPNGFHAQVISVDGNYYIDPVARGSSEYAVYAAAGQFDLSDLADRDAEQLFGDHDDHDDHGSESFKDGGAAAGDNNGSFGSSSRLDGIASRSGSELRTYRTAVAATGEYTVFHGGTVAAGQAAVVTAMNRVTGIYENELSIRFELVANNSQLIFTDGANDPYTNNNGGAMLGENQTTVDSIIGNGNYDIGHVFSTGGGGVAFLGSVGIDSIKAGGVTGLPQPINDFFYVDYVSHEIGHQFGGNHTFNGDSGACGFARNGSTAVEPGSGSTIQAYAGICGNDDIQQNSDPYFHSVSLNEMIDHVDGVIPSVGSRRPTGNSLPTVFAGLDYTIPASTPFLLTAFGNDADADNTLTYTWEQVDVGPQQDVNAGDNGQSTLFRSFLPTESPTRYFPRLPDLLSGSTTIGETLPTTNRSLTFQATIRDNSIGGGAVSFDQARLTVVDTGQTFEVTSQDATETWDGLSQQTVTWNVAGTAAAPIAAGEVDIFYSIDGGQTYPFLVAENEANDGQATFTVPNIETSTARLMVRGSDNVFFDINNSDLIVEAVPIDITFSNNIATYTENEAAVAVAPDVVVNETGDLNGLSIDITIVAGGQTGDRLGLIEGAGIAISAGSILFNGTEIANLQSNAGGLAIRLNANADAVSIEALLRNVAFENLTDSPTDTVRDIEFLFGLGISEVVSVAVVPTNDSPRAGDVALPTVAEDSPSPVGTPISQLFNPVFSDPDFGSSLSGVAIVANPQEVSTGTWFYSADGSGWFPVGDVDAFSQSLTVSSSGWLGFQPVSDYFGNPSPLEVRVLDDSFVGTFTDLTGVRNFLPSGSAVVNGPVAAVRSTISVEVANVNDPPFPTQPSLDINVFQDEAIDRVLSDSLFADIDSAELEWSFRSANSTALPVWLSFDPASRTLSGTPRNRDVGVYDFLLSVKDSDQASAEIPVQLTVTDVNDPPTDLRITANELRENRTQTVIGELFASDPDSGDTISWQSSDPRFFVSDGLLIASAAIDFEAEQTVDIVLTATDNGLPPASSSLPVTLNILDENEFFPNLQGGQFSLQDGTAAGSLVTTVRATDNDSLQTVRYRLASGDVSAFTLDSESGELSLAEDADINRKSSYRIFVEAFDSGIPRKARTSQFSIVVEPTNDFPPEVEPGATFFIAENTTARTRLGQISASDPDGTQLFFSLLNPSPNGWFEIDGGTGEVFATSQAGFDFESSQSYELQVAVFEAEAPFRQVFTTATVSVENVNEPATAVLGASVSTLQRGAIGSPVTFEDPEGDSEFTLATTDSRFEIRDGLLSLRPDAFVSLDQAGTFIEVIVTVADANDPAVSAALPVQVAVIENATPWQNPVFNVDVNGDGFVTGVDALQIINQLNTAIGSGPLQIPRAFGDISAALIDTNGDNALTPVDALLVINFINGQAEGEGENSRSPSYSIYSENSILDEDEEEQEFRDGIWLSAFLAIEEELKRSRR